MTLEQAYRLLHPDTTAEEIRRLDTDRPQSILAIEEACRIACECIKRCMGVEDDGK